MADETTTAHTEAPGGGGDFPPFDKTTFPSQLFWLAICFVALYLITARLVQPRVSGIIEGRRRQVAGDLAEASRLKTESEQAIAAYEKALADARGRAQGIANETREREAAAAEATNKRLEAALHERLAAAERSIAEKRESAMANVGTIASDTASAIVERLIGKAPAAHDVAAAVADAGKH